MASPASSASANNALLRFTQWAFDHGKALWLPTHAVLEVQTAIHRYRGRLRPAWSSMQSLLMQSPVRSRPPMPRIVLEPLRISSLLAGTSLDSSNSKRWWTFAALLGAVFWGCCGHKRTL